jgi:hypothetical protein
MRDRGSIPRGYLSESGILLSTLSHYIGDPDMINHCGLVWCIDRFCPESSLGRCANNVIIPLDLTQLFCPGFMLATIPPSGFTTDIVGCWGGALWRACKLTAFTHSSTGPVVHLFAACYEGLGFKPQGGTHVKPGFSCWRCLATLCWFIESFAISKDVWFKQLRADQFSKILKGELKNIE